MKWGISYLLLLSLLTSIALGVEKQSTHNQQCREVLDWIYRDLTLNNLELSYQRAMNKFLYSVHHAHHKTKNKRKYLSQMQRVFNTLRQIDRDFNAKNLINYNKTVGLTSFWIKNDFTNQKNILFAMKTWKQFQADSPHLFSDIDESYLLDDWDMQTLKLINNVSQYNFHNSDLKRKVELLADQIRKAQTNLIKKNSFTPEALNQSIKSTQKSLIEALNRGSLESLNDFSHICSLEDISFKISQTDMICPIIESDNFAELNLQLNSLQSLINQTGYLSNKTPTPTQFVEAIEYDYHKNPKATYCKRDPNMVSILAIHHTGESEYATPEEINQIHLDMSDEDPWLMIGYNYMISEYFGDATPSKPIAIIGRELDIQGSHASSIPVKLSPEQLEELQPYKVQCLDKETREFKSTTVNEIVAAKGGVSGNLISFGIAISGDYEKPSPTKIDNDEIFIKKPLKDQVKIPSDSVIKKTATLACQLQKQYPRIKTIVPHSYFRSTVCPGELINHLSKIADEANNLGCHFKVVLTKESQQ